MTGAAKRLVARLEQARALYDPDGEMSTFDRIDIRARRDTFRIALGLVLEHIDAIEYEAVHGADSPGDVVPFVLGRSA